VFGFGVIESGSSISAEYLSGSGSRTGSRSRVLMTKNLKAEKGLMFFLSKLTNYLYLGLHKGRPSYSRSLQPSKENIQHFKT
jgi:hypothetical protein